MAAEAVAAVLSAGLDALDALEALRENALGPLHAPGALDVPDAVAIVPLLP